MKNSILAAFEQKNFSQLSKLPKFRTGDTVKVDFKIQEGADVSKFRIQSFEGVVIRYKKGGANSSFTVRKTGANSIGVERTFSVVSPNLSAVKLVSSGVVRQARLFYLRERTGKAARIKSRYAPKSKAK
tara:strand:+ start:1274 stop:1660 length:387 start_codon:yes stop_codon:yes gene_type:complete